MSVRIAPAVSVVVRASACTRLGLALESDPVRFGSVLSRDEHLIVLGPLYERDTVMTQLAALGLEYFEDYFDISSSGGTVPEWCQVLLECRSEHDARTEEQLPVASLAAMLARCDRASSGPWTSMVEGRDHTSGSSFVMTGPPTQRGPDIELSGATAEDQEFIAHARQDVPHLVAEVRRLRALLGLQG